MSAGSSVGECCNESGSPVGETLKEFIGPPEGLVPTGALEDPIVEKTEYDGYRNIEKVTEITKDIPGEIFLCIQAVQTTEGDQTEDITNHNDLDNPYETIEVITDDGRRNRVKETDHKKQTKPRTQANTKQCP